MKPLFVLVDPRGVVLEFCSMFWIWFFVTSRKILRSPFTKQLTGLFCSLRSTPFIKSRKITKGALAYAFFVILVDPRGVEPLSENLLIQPSPSAVRYLNFPLQDVNGQTSRLGSHFLRGKFNGELLAHVHRYLDAQSEVAILLGGTGGVMPRHCP